MNFFRRVELKLNYSAATNFEKLEKVHKTRKNRPKTGGFMARCTKKDILLFCVIEGIFSFINQESR